MGRVAELALRHAAMGSPADRPVPGLVPAAAEAAAGAAASLPVPEQAEAAGSSARGMQQQALADGRSALMVGAQHSSAMVPSAGTLAAHAAARAQSGSPCSLSGGGGKPSLGGEEAMGRSSLVCSANSSLAVPLKLFGNGPSSGTCSSHMHSSRGGFPDGSVCGGAGSSDAENAGSSGHVNKSASGTGSACSSSGGCGGMDASSSSGRGSSVGLESEASSRHSGSGASIHSSPWSGGQVERTECELGVQHSQDMQHSPGHSGSEPAHLPSRSPAAAAGPAPARPLPRPLPAFCEPQPPTAGCRDMPALQGRLQAAVESDAASSAGGGPVAAAASGAATAGTTATAELPPSTSSAAGCSAAPSSNADANAQGRRSVQPQAGVAARTKPAGQASSDERLQAALDR